eukprot:scaffold1696_cov258-Pinguiococcus_pyrenoidosus.AAC.44
MKRRFGRKTNLTSEYGGIPRLCPDRRCTQRKQGRLAWIAALLGNCAEIRRHWRLSSFGSLACSSATGS